MNPSRVAQRLCLVGLVFAMAGCGVAGPQGTAKPPPTSAPATTTAPTITENASPGARPTPTRTPTPTPTLFPSEASGTPSPAAEPTTEPSLPVESTVAPRSEAPEVTDLLNAFLEARVAGQGAEQYLTAERPDNHVPLLYATTSGAPYERAEFERVLGYEWPYGWTAFKVRLFAGETLVEQLLFVGSDRPHLISYQFDGFRTNIAPTIEDGQPLTETASAFDGEVTLQIGHPWFFATEFAGARLIPEGAGPTTDGGQRHGWDELVLLADPELAATGCGDVNPTDAETLAESIRSDPNNAASAPLAVSVGGAEAWMMDVAATSVFCHQGIRWDLLDGAHRTRLYLFDAPEGSSMRILAIEMIASKSQFEYAVEAAATLVTSIEFHTP